MSVAKPFSELCGTLEALRQLAAVWNEGRRIKHFGAQLDLDGSTSCPVVPEQVFIITSVAGSSEHGRPCWQAEPQCVRRRGTQTLTPQRFSSRLWRLGEGG